MFLTKQFVLLNKGCKNLIKYLTRFVRCKYIFEQTTFSYDISIFAAVMLYV